MYYNNKKVTDELENGISDAADTIEDLQKLINKLLTCDSEVQLIKLAEEWYGEEWYGEDSTSQSPIKCSKEDATAVCKSCSNWSNQDKCLPDCEPELENKKYIIPGEINSAFDLYQKASHQTAVYPNVGNNINYVTLGLCDESGEVAGKIKKLMRDDKGVLTEERKKAIIKELGDVMWYVAEMATTLNVSLHDIAFGNVDKLQTRMKKGTLKGDGDDR